MLADRIGSWVNDGINLCIAIAVLIAAVRIWGLVWRHSVQAVVNCCRGQRVRDFLFDRADLDRLPAALADYFRQFTPEMEALGFKPIGDYRLLRAPWPVYARYFLAPDRRCFSAIVCNTRDLQTYCFFSIRDDRSYVETAALGLPDVDREQLQIWCYPDLPVEELYAKHREHLWHSGRNKGSRPVEMTADDVQAASQFGRRLAGISAYLMGKRIEPPNL
jgi:hypothetical protein